MKSIQDYISEGLLNKKNIGELGVKNGEGQSVDKFRRDTVQISWPADAEGEKWQKMNLVHPDKFVVYYDVYHKCKHISSFGGMLESYIFNETFEDFTPDTMIASFKTLKEAVKYAVEDADPEKYVWDKVPDVYDPNYRGEYSLKGYYDDMCFCKAVLKGNEKESDYEDTTEFFMYDIPTEKEIKNLVRQVK